MNFWKKVRDWNAKYKTESRERVVNSNSQSNTNIKREIPKEITKEQEMPTANNRLKNDNKTLDYKKEFLKTFKSLTYSHQSWNIWNDFVTMLACSISNSVDKTHYDEREKLYLSIIEKYNKEEQLRRWKRIQSRIFLVRFLWIWDWATSVTDNSLLHIIFPNLWLRLLLMILKEK